MTLRFSISGILPSFIFLFLLCSTGPVFSRCIQTWRCIQACQCIQPLCLGESCTVNGLLGIGTFLKKCIPVYNDFRNGHRPYVGGYYFFEPIVCCPLNESTTATATTTATPTTVTTTITATPTESTSTATRKPIDPKAIAQQKCNEYSLIGNKPKQYKVVNANITKPKEFPHMAAIFSGEPEFTNFICGGTLISERYVLTAAHCFNKYILTWIRVGDLNLNRTDDNAKSQNYKINETIKHSNYDAVGQYHDIALLKLEKNVIFNEFVRPACLPYFLSNNYSNANITGWGRYDEGDVLSEDLRNTDVPLISHKMCKKYYPDVNDEYHICAGKGGKDTRKGDSGGPLSVWNEEYEMHTVIGVTSFGNNTHTKWPGVYTRVSYYINWIQSVVWPELSFETTG